MPDMTPRRKMLLSRDLRRRSTYTEKLAWNLLRDRRCFNLKFRRQYGVAGFIVDFYCPDLKLAIEIDGSSHIGREGYDEWRQQLIEQESISFIRITNEVLESNPEVLVDRIRAFLNEPASPPPPLQLAWRGGGGEAYDPRSKAVAFCDFATFPVRR